MSKVVTVFGATGFIGSSVARALSKDYRVRAVTRDPNSPKAQALKDEGIQLVYADPSDKRCIQDALDGATACFFQTNTDHSKPDAKGTEIAHGKLIADACVQANVNHVIYSTQLSVVKVLSIPAKHMDAKAEVEQYMKDLGLQLTGIIVPLPYENLLLAPLRPKKIEAKFYGFGIPMGTTPLNMICTEDVGAVVRHILANPKSHIDRTVSICGDKLTVKEIAEVFTKHLEPIRFKDTQVTVDEFRSVDFPGAYDMANMFAFYCRVDQRASIDITKKLNPDVQSLSQWLQSHKDIANQALQ